MDTTRDVGDTESNGSEYQDKFGHLLKFPEEIAPVFEDLKDEQAERRKLDQVRVDKNIMFLDSINRALDINVHERIESDQILEKLNITRLDAMQRKLVNQIEIGFKELNDELDEARERLRVATEKLYQQEVDAEIQLAQMRDEITKQMDSCQEQLLFQSQARVETDLEVRATIPEPILTVWRALGDEKDVMEGCQGEARERLMPLEHSDLNDIERSVAQQRIRQEISELLAAIQEETRARIEEEKSQAARARVLTDAMAKGLKIVNRNYYHTPVSTPVPEPPEPAEGETPEPEA
mmetsp:Transcript_39096/g.92218  ORF Transcript_39096/g.92218 Transcript_39096/m.92218 type:complete len:294 (-) Transcript_39096:1001-1882(-)